MTGFVSEYLTSPIPTTQGRTVAAINWSARRTAIGFQNDGIGGFGIFARQPFPTFALQQFACGTGMYEFAPPAPGVQDSAHGIQNAWMYSDNYQAGDGFGNNVEVFRDRCRKLICAIGDNSSYKGILALTGSRTRAYAGFVHPTSSGPLSFTGLGFQPQILIFGNARTNTFFDSDEGCAMGIGATDGTNQWAQSVFGPYLSFPGYVLSKRQEDACILTIGDSSITLEANIASLDADGFTLNVVTPGDVLVMFLAIYDPDGDFAVGNATQGAATLPVGFEPDGMIFSSIAATSSAFQNFGGWAVGGAGNGSDQCAGAMTEQGQLARRYWASGSALSMIFQPNILLAEMNVSDFNAGGGDVALNWTTDDAGSRRFGWAAFKTHGSLPCVRLLPILGAGI